MKTEENSDHLNIVSNDRIDSQTNYENIQFDNSFHINSSYEYSNGIGDECENSESGSIRDTKNGSPDCYVMVEQPSNAYLYNSTINVQSDQFHKDFDYAEQFFQPCVKLVETSIKSDQPLKFDNENHAIDTLDATPSDDRIALETSERMVKQVCMMR